LQNVFLDSSRPCALPSRGYLSPRPLSLLVPVPALGVLTVGAVVAPVLLVLRSPLLKLLLLGALAPDAPMVLLRVVSLFKVSVGDAPSLARLPDVAPVLEVLVRGVDWHPAASAAASATATMAAGRIDDVSM
jgi:hypothetical protein